MKKLANALSISTSWGGDPDMQKTYYIQLEDGQYIIVSMDRDGIHGNAYNYDQDKEQQK